MWRLALLISSCAVVLATPAAAQTCRIDFTVEVTQGVGEILPGARLVGHADYTALARSFSQEAGATAYLAQGDMTLEPGIRGQVWAIITSSHGPTADQVGVYARDVDGLSFGGVEFGGPMILTLFGPPGTAADAEPPTTQADWDRLDLRRAFTLHAHGSDMLSGNVTDLVVHCG